MVRVDDPGVAEGGLEVGRGQRRLELEDDVRRRGAAVAYHVRLSYAGQGWVVDDDVRAHVLRAAAQAGDEIVGGGVRGGERHRHLAQDVDHFGAPRRRNSLPIAAPVSHASFSWRWSR